MTDPNQRILDLIQYSVGRKRQTFGHGFESAYHDIAIGDIKYKGQRNVAKRIARMGYDFKGKTVLDIGCNIGGILHHLSQNIHRGIGIDSNAKCINAANAIRSANQQTSVDFFVFDVTKEPLATLEDFSIDPYDVILFLSMALWIKNWKDVVKWIHPRDLIYETNGNDLSQAGQVVFLKQRYFSVIQLTEQSDDDKRPGGKSKLRRMYLCRN
jgi:2-polyprenyl-3-methyl-5-hydroxy-6-metoxy-1,4-benzoquinol methylase